MTAQVLIVDDIEANAQILSIVAQDQYYAVLTARNGIEAIACAQNWQPDVIILDVMMPELDGYETCRRLKADERTMHIPVVMVTALDGAAEKLRGLECGADDFLTRPIDTETFLARVKGLVRLKQLFDEWRARHETTRALGLAPEPLDRVEVSGTRALIVDDWDLGAASVEKALAEDGVQTVRAANEEEAIAIGASHPLSLIVINLSMRGFEPLRLASRLRANVASRDIPLLLIAEPDHRDLVLRGFDLGVNDWISRPLNPNELRVRARNQIRRKLYQDRLRSALDGALKMALTDPLTGLYNRRYFMRHLEGVLSARQLANVALLMIDVDSFKIVNDRFGHQAGDAALELLGERLRLEARAVDLIARLGGEEFAVVMIGAGLNEVAATAERIRAKLAAEEFAPAPESAFPLTVSIGAAVAQACDISMDKLMRAADRALYLAKARGRNRVEVVALEGPDDRTAVSC
ncbi:PleD family two-component system response regulator [Mycobacterium sp. KBS0706]|uniref:PleD family two-component system response regulator n=1 Tax=Mycobacterium sp. KBS0706 TaxID=2578109 RepID=UPI00110F961D|nr:PleD family two-component system response regulator [Mycobacterium sp. KBS0706]TSD85120.1 PleD family two-component system response regulator [Mycobacterium sp. KBS0706]